MPPRALGRLHPDDLIRYSRPLNGKELYITSNPGAARHILTGRYPTRVTCVAYMRSPDSDGLPMDSEAIALNESEEQLLSKFAGTTNQLLNAGRLTFDGHRVLVFHSELQQPVGPGPSMALKTLQYEWHTYYDEDPDAIFVQAIMVPTPMEARRAYDRRQIMHLEEADDDTAVPRTINFHASFPSPADMAAAVAILSDSKFKCEAPTMQRDRSWTFAFSYDASADPETIERLTSYAQSVCTQCLGTYDGWDCSTAK